MQCHRLDANVTHLAATCRSAHPIKLHNATWLNLQAWRAFQERFRLSESPLCDQQLLLQLPRDFRQTVNVHDAIDVLRCHLMKCATAEKVASFDSGNKGYLTYNEVVHMIEHIAGALCIVYARHVHDTW